MGITPLIDIIFLLLIFFMLTSRFVVHEGIGLELPVTQAPHTLEAEEVREITVLRETFYRLRENPGS
ncbi:MAG: biopolymer transporter ExbD, partial [Proteobacteria bacterium]|nr:biopolymer transporter ExbD [Pseudomonadota bacterium]